MKAAKALLKLLLFAAIFRTGFARTPTTRSSWRERRKPRVEIHMNDKVMNRRSYASPIVLEDYKFIFFPIQKTGCTVWKQLFRRISGFQDWRTGSWLGVFISHHIYARHGLPRSHVLIFRLRRASFFRFQSASGILHSPEDIIFTMFTVSPWEKFRFLILFDVYRVWFAYLKRAMFKKKSVNSILSYNILLTESNPEAKFFRRLKKIFFT